MDGLRYANIMLDIFCIILSMLLIVHIFSVYRYRRELKQSFLGVCISNIFMIIGDLFDWIFPSVENASQRLILTAATALYYVASAFVLYFFMRYIIEYLQAPASIKRFSAAYTSVLCTSQIFFALLSPFTGFVFYITDSGYQRGPLFIISQLIPLFFYVMFFALLIIHRKKLRLREIVFSLLYIFIPLGSGAVQMAMRGIAIVNAGITVAALVMLMNIQFEYEAELNEQEKELDESRIDIMLSQIQPHFLYNSLGTIYHLCGIDSERARKAIKNFSEFLRGNMDSLRNRGPIAFDAELNHVTNYLYLEQQRFGDKLQVIYQIETEDFMIPPLTLQPLVENAVNHGVLNRREGGTVVISTGQNDKFAVVKIYDNGIGMEKAREYPTFGKNSHIGIENVRSRLKEMVGGSLYIQSSGKGTEVTIQIPLSGGES
jgi:two-component system LytT family sensor kinase